MTRKIAAGCFAAMFGLAVSAGAQTPSSPQTPSPATPDAVFSVDSDGLADESVSVRASARR